MQYLTKGGVTPCSLEGTTPGGLGGVRLQVSPEDVEDARAILEETRNRPANRFSLTMSG